MYLKKPTDKLYTVVVIDFSAFPVPRPKSKVLIISATLVVILGLVASFVLIAQPGDAEKKIGMALFQIIIFSIITIMFVILIIIPIWFMWRIIIPRIRSIGGGTYGNHLSAYDSTSLFERFASDNSFRYRECPPRQPAPKKLYEALYRVTEYDSVYLLYEVTGNHNGTNFILYCLAFAEGKSINLISRRGMAYAHDSDRRKIEYMTVLKVPKRSVRSSQKGVGSIDYLDGTYIYSEGYLTDRKQLKSMFGTAFDTL